MGHGLNQSISTKAVGAQRNKQDQIPKAFVGKERLEAQTGLTFAAGGECCCSQGTMGAGNALVLALTVASGMVLPYYLRIAT